MTDVLDRMAAANPARDDELPPIGDVWRKIAASAPPADPGRWRHRSARVVLMAAVVVPVLAVIVIALSGHTARRTPARPPVNQGHRLHSTIDPAVQRSARRALAGRSGSIVVMNPQTGAVEAFASAGGLRGGAGTAVPPGATFDVVTVAAALGSGRFGPNSLISGASPLGVGGSQVRNDEDQSLGRVTLSDALTFSVNTVFARLGADVGAEALTRQMRLFDLSPQRGAGANLAVGRLAAGQGTVTATPLQLAGIAATIANGGRLAQPHMQQLSRQVPQRTVMTAGTAGLLAQMLRRVVTQGTGTAANLPGLRIAGKTGTAPAGGANGAHGTVASFIGFAPADHPTVAIAVVLTVPRGGFGGIEAAPTAARVIHEVLRGRL